MTNQVTNEHFENAYLWATNTKSPSRHRNLNMLSKCLEIILFVSLSCAVINLYRNVWDLTCEVELLKERLKYRLPENDDIVLDEVSVPVHNEECIYNRAGKIGYIYIPTVRNSPTSNMIYCTLV